MISVENIYRGYSASWDLVSKTNTVKLSNRCHARLVREAQEHFDGFGIDFSQYSTPVVILHEEIVAQVDWEHKTSGKKISLLRIYFDEKTGAISQCGENYGDIVS